MQMVLISLFSLIIGGVLLLYGFRVLRAVLPVWGFLAGFWLGADLAALALGQGFMGTIAGWAAGLIFGAVGAALAHFFHHLSIGLVGAVIGYHLGSGLLSTIGLGGILAALGGLVLAILAASLFFGTEFQHSWSMLMSSTAGANAVLLSLLLLIGRVSVDGLQDAGNAVQPVFNDSWLWLLAWLALIILGYFYQRRGYSVAVSLDHGVQA